ncbi:MAG: hypothetical protein WD397_05595 [Wenzhouxiangellaceae bacterium]
MKVAYILTGVLLLALFWWLGDSPRDEIQPDHQPPKAETPTAVSPQPEPDFGFELVDQSFNDTPIKAQVEQHVVVTGKPTAADVDAELRRRYQIARERGGWRHHGQTTNVYIYIYGSEVQARAGRGLWLGMVSWVRTSQSPPDFTVNQDRLDVLGEKPEERFGLTESERKQFLTDLADAQERAMTEAMRRVPDSRINEQIDLEQDLRVRYETEIMERWSLTEEQVAAIRSEALRKSWVY